MICRCGFQNDPEDLYCAQCGKKLSRRKMGPKVWMIAIVVFLFLAAGAVAALFLIPGEEEPDPEETQSQEEAPESGEEATEEEESGESAIPENGWDDSGVFYYEDGKPVTGLREIKGEYYYFHLESGQMQTGWVEIDGSWHYFTEEGPAPGAGWYTEKEKWLYLEANGRHRVESFLDEENKREYTLDEEGYLIQMKCAELLCTESEHPLDETSKPALLIPGTLNNCASLTFHHSKGIVYTSDGDMDWNVWIRLDDVWTRISDVSVVQEEGCGIVTFSQPQTFDAICIYSSAFQNLKVNGMLTDIVIEY